MVIDNIHSIIAVAGVRFDSQLDFLVGLIKQVGTSQTGSILSHKNRQEILKTNFPVQVFLNVICMSLSISNFNCMIYSRFVIFRRESSIKRFFLYFSFELILLI